MPDPIAPTRTAAPKAVEPGATLALTGTLVETPEPPRPADIAPGYVVIHEIARGGMGRVVAARDPRLGREVAIKFLLPTSDPSAAARFVREAEITARLPHPSVPPVYALGRTPEGQPFLVMKLVRGRTLSDLLTSRPSPAHDLPRFVTVFEQVCQAVGYAHSQGIVHRDIKPGNVMVGAFGEVQVMDWGLALAHSDCGMRGAESKPAPTPAPCPGFDSAFRTPHSALTQAGTVLGTPGYMAPEQARGEGTDARADVFALGALLAAVLTGRQPIPDSYTARSAAADGIVAAAVVREELADAGADPELTRLAYQCLSPNPDDRPADGKAVADAIAAHRAKAEDRARRAEAGRAAVVARAAADARTRRARVGLVMAVSVVIGLVGAIGWWRDRAEYERTQAADRAEQERILAADRAEAEQARITLAWEAARAADRRSARETAERSLDLADELRDRFRFDQADTAVAAARKLVASAEAADLAARVARVQAHLDTVRALDAARTRQTVWVPVKAGLGKFADASGDFRRAFVAAGFDVAGGDLKTLGERVQASPIRAQLVAALDDWAPGETDRALQARVLEVARRADPNPWTDRLRDPGVRTDPARLAALAADADPEKVSPAALVSLARRMIDAKLDPAPLLLRAHSTYPADFRIAFHLGDVFTPRDPRRAIGFYQTARALRPDNFAVNINLGACLNDTGDAAAARDAFRAAARIDPQSPMAAYNLGRTLAATGDPLGGAALLRRATHLLPSYTNAHLELIRVLEQAGDRRAAVEAARAAVRCLGGVQEVWDRLGGVLDRSTDHSGYLDVLRELAGHAPGFARIHMYLGGALVDAGKLDEGIAALLTAARIDPLAPTPYLFLGIAHDKKGDDTAAVRYFRMSTEIDPTNSWAQTRLGGALVNAGRVDEGIVALRAAVRLAPGLATAHRFLGIAHSRKGDHAAAVASFRRAAELDPATPGGPFSLGTALLHSGQPAVAIAHLREAVRRQPNDPQPWTNLGAALLRTGQPAEAAGAYRTALRLAPGFPPAANGLADIERLLAP